jgi:hypothetical protein
LVALVNRRRRLLNYLCRERPATYVNVIKELSIRHKDPDRILTRAEKYAKFKNTKAVPKKKKRRKKQKTMFDFSALRAKLGITNSGRERVAKSVDAANIAK